MAAHAKFSPSAMYQVRACPGSWAANYGKQSKSSVAAQEGTDAHTFAQWCIENDKDPLDYTNKELDIFGSPEPKMITLEMAEAVKVYDDYVREVADGAAYAIAEIKLQMPGHIDFWGTADMVIAHDFGVLEVVDYKNGQGKDVYPENDEQVAAYMLGALRFASDHDITPAVLKGTIIQPRIHTWTGPRTWVIEDIDDFERTWIKVFSDAIIACLSEDATRSAGEHCTFCEAKLECPALKNDLLLHAIDEFKDAPPAEIKTADVKELVMDTSLEDLLRIHTHASIIKKFLKEAAAHLSDKARAGEHITGHKLVRSLGNRTWNLPDDEMAKKFRNKKLKQEDFYDRTIKSPAKMKDFIDDGKFFDKFVIRPDKGTLLVADTDKRAPVIITSAVEDFGDD